MGPQPEDDAVAAESETAVQVQATAAASLAVDLIPGAVLGGRYVVQSVLGRGGMGVVVRALDRVVQAELAIKILRPEYAQDPRWTDRLAHEVKLARTIGDPNVCRVFDFEQADGHAFITMELATGGTLRDALALNEAAVTRTAAERIADATAVIRGLAAIHAAGIVHRDVTPQNVLRMHDGRLVVSDFGLASAVSGTTTSIQGGTVGYMAPEVLRGERADQASDVWSLGLIIHQILIGSRPEWKGQSAPLVVVKGNSRSRAERALLAICSWCLTIDPARRPASARDVLRFLDSGERIPRRRPAWRIGVLAGLAIAGAVLGTGLNLRRQPKGTVNAPVQASEIPTLTPMTNHSNGLAGAHVLATYDARIECAMPLPDHQTIRVVVDYPRRSEDIDIATGARRLSSLRPDTIREGCARLSPNGQRLAYQGRDEKGRPHILVSQNPTGDGAVPVVSSSEPSMSSEPQWIDDDTFLFDVDYDHAALFSLTNGRITIVPNVERRNPDRRQGTSKSVGHGQILVSYGASSATAETLVTIFDWPALREVSKFKILGFAMDFQVDETEIWASVMSGDYFRLLHVSRDGALRSELLAPAAEESLFNFASISQSKKFFVQRRYFDRLLVTAPAGGDRAIEVDGHPMQATQSRRGDILVARSVGDRTFISRYDSDGGWREDLTDGTHDSWPEFFSDGDRWLFGRLNGERGVYQCALSHRGCIRLPVPDTSGGPLTWPVVPSPDDTRVAFVGISERGPIVRVMNLDGTNLREVAESETACAPQWSASDRLWISRRLGGALVWVETNVTGAETGRRHPGMSSCAAGNPDPGAPMRPLARVETSYRSEIKLLDAPPPIY